MHWGCGGLSEELSRYAGVVVYEHGDTIYHSPVPHPPFLCLQYVYVVSDGKIGEREGEGEGEGEGELETGLVLPMC